MLIEDRYALQSERLIVYPIIPDQAIKIGRNWSGVGRLSGVNVGMPTEDAYSSGHLVLSHFGTCMCSNVETNLS